MHPNLGNIILDTFADEEGVLRRGHLDGLSAVWVPPYVKLAVVGRSKMNVVVYPVPDALSQGAENRRELSGELPQYLEEAGWKIRPVSAMKSLVEDFVALAEGTDEDVRSFCEKYGPLWICTRHWHFWTAQSPENIDFSNPDPQAFCLWLHREPVGMFRAHAKQLKAWLEIAECLTDPKSKAALAIHYERLMGDAKWASLAGPTKREQRDFLATMISGYILQGVTLWVSWKGEPRPRLTLQTGLGFMGLAWLQTAQLVAGGVEMRNCSGCHRSYFRTERKPPKGWNNFCEKCRKSDARKISKRLWAEKSRRKQREVKAGSSRKKISKRRD